MTPDSYTTTTTTYTESWNNVWDGARTQAAALHIASGFWTVFALITLGLALFYFLPTVIATARRHPHALLIFLINLLFGVTVAGWIVALLWALTTPSPSRTPFIYRAGP